MKPNKLKIERNVIYWQMLSFKTKGKHLHTNSDLAKKCANDFRRFYMKKKAIAIYLAFIENMRKTFPLVLQTCERERGCKQASKQQ